MLSFNLRSIPCMYHLSFCKQQYPASPKSSILLFNWLSNKYQNVLFSGVTNVWNHLILSILHSKLFTLTIIFAIHPIKIYHLLLYLNHTLAISPLLPVIDVFLRQPFWVCLLTSSLCNCMVPRFKPVAKKCQLTPKPCQLKFAFFELFSFF